MKKIILMLTLVLLNTISVAQITEKKNDVMAIIPTFFYSPPQDSAAEMAKMVQNTAYTYKVYSNIYKNGVKIYSQDREPFLSGINTWRDAAEYMLKRTPIFKK